MKTEYILAIQDSALAEVLADNPSFEYFYRRTCRQYSEKFNTPLPQVYSLSFDDVLRDVVESRYEAILAQEDGDEDLLEIAQKIVDPNYEAKEEAENEAAAKRLIEEENLKRARQMAKELNLNPSKPQPLKSESPSPTSAPVHSRVFDDEIPPEAFESDLSGLDDL